MSVKHRILENRTGRVSRCIQVLLIHLLVATGVAGRTPQGPLPRHRDVTTTHGTVRGYFAPRPPHYAYLGVPYARPPTLARFKAPTPAGRWDGTFEATHRVQCLQPGGVGVRGTRGVRDCLAANVFVPARAQQLPVLLHVHGGRFQRGWGSHKAPARLLRLGFVVVTFNYRLGPLGFLCLRSAGAPGNAGLKDQVAALYWVHRNIARFGGDPRHVTLYGSGGGGVSVELLLLSGLATDLIHKAIVESGAVLSPSTISYDPFGIALTEAISLGFEGNVSTETRDLQMFYENISLKLLANSTQTFLPCVENNLLSDGLLDVDPLEILKRGTYQHVPLLIIYTNAEEVSIVEENIENFNVAPKKFVQLLPTNLHFETDDTKEKIAVMVRDFYFEEYELSDSVVQNYIDYINDIFMEYPITKSSMLHAAKSSHPVYLMKFTYKGGLSSTELSQAEERRGDIFNYISLEDTNGIDEIHVERLLTLFSNFIKLGDPTPITTSLIPVIWQPLSAREVDGKINIQKVSYLHYDTDISNVSPKGQQLLFWDYIYEKFRKQHI